MSRWAPVVGALLLGAVIGWAAGAREFERAGSSASSLRAVSEALNAEVEVWKVEARRARHQADSLTVIIDRWQREVEVSRQSLAAARQRLRSRDELYHELLQLDADSLAQLATVVLRERFGPERR